MSQVSPRRLHVLAAALFAAAAILGWIAYADSELMLQLAALPLCR